MHGVWESVTQDAANKRRACWRQPCRCGWPRVDRAQICKQDGVHEANGGSVLCGFCQDDGIAAVQGSNPELSAVPAAVEWVFGTVVDVERSEPW